jgi:hypothetical protein
MPDEEIIRDAKRYRLLRDYLIKNGFVIHERINEDATPFVLDVDFYGHTFEDAVDMLPDLPKLFPGD